MMRKTIWILVSSIMVLSLLLTACNIPQVSVSNPLGRVAGAEVNNAKPDLITVLNPLGQPPGLRLRPLAERLDTLNGKTIYVVDVKYPATKPFFEELEIALNAKYPNTNWIVREKKGSYFEDDPALWAEIKAEGDGMVIGVGH